MLLGRGRRARGARTGRRHGAGGDPPAADLVRIVGTALDEETIHDSREELRALIEASPVPIFAYDTEGIVWLWNRAAERVFGWSEEEAVGRFLPIVPDDMVDEFRQVRERVLAGGAFSGFETTRRRKDDTPIEVCFWNGPVRGRDGEIRGVVALVDEITDRKRRERSLRFLAEASAVLAGSLDYRETLAQVTRLAVPALADWCFLDVVREDGTVERLVVEHADPSKLALAEPFRKFALRPGWQTPQARVLATGEAILIADATDDVLQQIAHDEDHLAAMREVAPRSVMYVPLAARGRLLGSITFASAESGRRYDQDDLLLAEEIGRRAAVAVDNARLYEAAEDRARAARVLAAIGDGVALVDGDGVVRLWNPAAETITGLASADVVGRVIGDAVPGWEAIAPRIPVGAPRASGARPEAVPLELRGRERWLSVTGVGSEEGTIYAFRDISEERRVEEVKSEFFAIVSHELRTPLAAVYGAAMTLRRTDLELDEETRSRLLFVIGDQSDRLAAIVNDILVASKLGSGTIHLESEHFDPAELARGVVEAARAHAPSEIAIEVQAGDDLPAVWADAGRARQVLTNLVENAVKYSPDGGVIAVEVMRAVGAVRFCVRDPGIGIPAPEHERIFGRFYRLDPHLTRGVGGTGLGLYISRELVRRMGGRIWVVSREGEGSTFSVELPSVPQ